MRDEREYRIIAAYDTETTNLADDDGCRAFFTLYQVGTCSIPIESVTNANVTDSVSVVLKRHAEDAYSIFDELICYGEMGGYIPVVMVHNLGFDMYSLVGYFQHFDVEVLAKSRTKPVCFKLKEDDKVKLVFWDTLVFTQKSLERMGEDCGFPKLKGFWDYDRIRTPETNLTADEVAYAKHDIYCLFAYMGWYLRNNQMIDPKLLGCRIYTKTGVVRYKRLQLFKSLKGKGLKHTVGQYWQANNIWEFAKTDDELFTMHACTRGGFTFCASANASRVFGQDGRKVLAFDATSQHPAQMVSHYYPVHFKKQSIELLTLDLDIIDSVSVERVLNMYDKPFPVAFNVAVHFVNLRPKAGSLFERFGILPLASARVKQIKHDTEDNEEYALFLDYIEELGYKDSAINPRFEFGKLVSAGECILFLTELAYWEVSQAYDYDAREVLGGYDTARFARATDMSVISVIEFYRNKNSFKDALHGKIDDAELGRFESDYMIGLLKTDPHSQDVKHEYLGLKADLNALFGIEATNECRAETILCESGIEYEGTGGLANAPDKPKTWYQFGQRIVGWSRIAQILIMNLLAEINGLDIINGDTDSIKVAVDEQNKKLIEQRLSIYNDAIDKAKRRITKHIADCYPSVYDPLESIGHYVLEFETDRFVAVWNKAYMYTDDGKINIVLAGIPGNARSKDADGTEYRDSLEDLANAMLESGSSFSDVANLLLGYNTYIDSEVTKLKGRKNPEWGEYFAGSVTDSDGNACEVLEPAAVAIFDMVKVIGSTDNAENATNCRIAKRNNPHINTDDVLVKWHDGKPYTVEL